MPWLEMARRGALLQPPMDGRVIGAKGSFSRFCVGEPRLKMA